jgi:hypothetical protein
VPPGRQTLLHIIIVDKIQPTAVEQKSDGAQIFTDLIFQVRLAAEEAMQQSLPV